MHSILGRGLLLHKLQHQWGVAWKWSACGSAEALLSLELICIVGSTVSHLTLENIHRFHIGFRSGMLVGQSSTVISWSAIHLEVVLALWAGAKVLLEKEVSISIKLVSRWKHKVLPNLLVEAALTMDLIKHNGPNSIERHGTPNHHWLQKLHTGLQAAWILCLSSLPPDSRPWFPNEMQNLLLSEKRLWTTEQHPSFSLLSPGKMLLTLFLVQKWLGSPFPEDIWLWGLLMHWLQHQSTPCKALLPSGLNWLCLRVFSSLRSSLLLVQLFFPISSFQSTLHLICFDTALCEQPPLSVMTFCDLPSL